MRARGLLVAAVLGVALVPASAWGDCALPAAVVVPPDGATLPPNPVLFVFVPDHFGIRPSDTLPLTIVDRSRAKVSFRVTRFGAVPAFAAYRVDLSARAGTRITVGLRHRLYPDITIARTYSVTDAWKRPPRGTTTVTKVAHASSKWTCSYQSSSNLTPSRLAPAYRVEWALSPEDWRRGARGKLVLPYASLEFWEEKKASQAALLELGHLDCLGFTFEWKGKPIYVGIAALHPDGSEDPPAAEPVRVSPP